MEISIVECSYPTVGNTTKEGVIEKRGSVGEEGTETLFNCNFVIIRDARCESALIASLKKVVYSSSEGVSGAYNTQ